MKGASITLVFSLLLTELACPRPAPPDLVALAVRVEGAPTWTAVLAESMAYVPGLPADVRDADASAAPADDALLVEVALGVGLGCTECYAVSGSGRAYAVTASDVLGAQYALTAILEAHGARFFHPDRPIVPAVLRELDAAAAAAGGLAGELVIPEVRDRILHLHTLHPIEGFFALWDGAAADLPAARRIIDWIVRQRGDGLQYPGLSDVLGGGSAGLLWRAHTAQVLDYAHSRGLTVGLGVQLFSGSNLQQAFDLLPAVGTEAVMRATMEERLGEVLDGLPFDRLSLSFGEFFSSEPVDFLAGVDLAVEIATTLAPGIGISGVIHVGEDLVVEWEGEELIYYFLVQYADPPILPAVHTVMYYDLFEDAGGAYGHDAFDRHREFLLARLAAGEPVGYFPESAYWVAYDVSVPTYLPLYVRSRWIDLDGIKREAGSLDGLTEHALFSSGWEWGYWQQDYATMRFAHTVPDDWRAAFTQMFLPWEEPGAALAAAVVQVAEIEHRFLIEGRLGQYLGGRDSTMDAGEGLGIVAQPSRVRPATVLAMTDDEALAFDLAVVAPLAAFAEALEGEVPAVAAAAAGLAEHAALAPFVAEIVDGVSVTAARARHMASLYGATMAHRGGDEATRDTLLAAATQACSVGALAVARRHAALHSATPDRLLQPAQNATIYDYGYLLRADELCFWARDELTARNLLLGETSPVPGCAL